MNRWRAGRAVQDSAVIDLPDELSDAGVGYDAELRSGRVRGPARLDSRRDLAAVNPLNPFRRPAPCHVLSHLGRQEQGSWANGWCRSSPACCCRQRRSPRRAPMRQARQRRPSRRSASSHPCPPSRLLRRRRGWHHPTTRTCRPLSHAGSTATSAGACTCRPTSRCTGPARRSGSRPGTSKRARSRVRRRRRR